MSTQFTINPTRYNRQTATATLQDKTNYVAIMQNLLFALQNETWHKSTASLGNVGMPEHDFSKGPYIDDKYDAYKMCGLYNTTTQKYYGYAGCVAYRFAVPTSYKGHYDATNCHLDTITFPATRDRFLKTGYNIHVVASNSDTPSTDWNIIHADADASGSDVTISRQNTLASQSSVTNLVDAVPLTSTITIDTTSQASQIASKDYIWVYLTLNDYADSWSRYNAKEARMYAIEGSAAFTATGFSYTFTDTNGIVTPDTDPISDDDTGTGGDNQKLMKKIIYSGTGFIGAAAITIGALWYGGKDADGDLMPDEWVSSFEVLRSIDDADQRMAYAVDGDYMAYADIKGGLIVASNKTSGVVAPYYFDNDYCIYANLGGECSNLQVRTAFPYGSTMGVGSNLVLTTDNIVTGYSRSRSFRLCHFQVYEKFGYEPNVATAQDSSHTKPFTALDKYLLSRFMLENGLGIGEANVAKNATTPSQYTTLVPGVTDYDNDGAPDGLELYMMFGPNAVSLTNNHLNAWSAADAQTDYDNDGLPMTVEMNGGVYHLNPWLIQSSREGLVDYYAALFNIRRNAQSTNDEDGDGLSNYTEYLASKVFGFNNISPYNQHTSDGVNDYFRKQGEFYLGEIFQDHDRVDDDWENAYGAVANSAEFDPDRDDDNDGWGNYAEFMAETDPSKQVSVGVDGKVAVEMPIPLVQMEVFYNGFQELSGNLIVDAINEDMKIEARWSLGNESSSNENVENSKYIGAKPSNSRKYHFGKNVIIEGTFKGAFKVLNYEIGEDVDGVFKLSKYGDPAEAEWVNEIVDRGGKLYDAQNNSEVGSIDYANGIVTVDFANSALNDYVEIDRVVSSSNAVTSAITNTTIITRMSLADSYVNFSWREKSLKTSGKRTYYFSDADSDQNGTQEWITSGKKKFLVFDDLNKDSAYTPGEPFGCAVGVDVGWQDVKFSVEMTDVSPITPRISLPDGADDRSTTIADINKILLNDCTTTGADARTYLSNFVAGATLDMARQTHVRMIRYGVDDMCGYRVGIYDAGEGSGMGQRVVLDKTCASNSCSLISEADFLSDDEFDLEWNTLSGSDFRLGFLVDKYGNPLGTASEGPKAAGLKITNMTYLVAIDNGIYDAVGTVPSSNGVVNTLATIAVRRFETTRHKPETRGAPTIVYSARPTFRWAMPDEETWAKEFGSTYSAFKVEVLDKSGVTVIYDSGTVRAPKQIKDSNGELIWEWTAPVSAGDQTSLGKIFARSGDWKWRVAMYNAKFKPQEYDRNEGYWSDVASFSTAVGQQQMINDHGYSAIDVAVKYAGSTNVLQYVDDMSVTDGKIRVQAFSNPNFSGYAMSQTFITNIVAITDATDTSANGTLWGLANGTYYIRAYLDSNGNMKKDDWESWGSAAQAVVIDENTSEVPLVSVWIEDQDTNNDYYPDAYQYAVYGNLSNRYTIATSGAFNISSNAMMSAIVGRYALSSTLRGANLAYFQDATLSGLVLGNTGVTNITYAAFHDEVQTIIDNANNSLEIESAVIDGNNVVLAMNTKTAENIAGVKLNRYFLVEPNTSRTVTIKIYRKSSVLQAEWELVNTTTTTVGCTDRTKSVEIPSLAAEKGLLKVVVE